MTLPSKKPWQSKTLIFNSLCALAACTPELAEALPVLKPLVGEQFYQALTAILLLGNTLLRCMTKVGLALRGDPF